MVNIQQWTPERLVSFSQAYTRALHKRKDTFVWEGHGFLTRYAKYLIEYLEGRFK